jgi:hypothetical protein
MPSQMFPRRCGVDGCAARIIETMHPGVFVCLALQHDETPVFEIRSDDEILHGTGHVVGLPEMRA